jgi:hypothetical protein
MSNWRGNSAAEVVVLAVGGGGWRPGGWGRDAGGTFGWLLICY